jgi:hypothetical protein
MPPLSPLVAALEMRSTLKEFSSDWLVMRCETSRRSS